MDTVLWICCGLIFYIAAMVTYLYTHRGVELAFLEGRRAGLKEAVAVAKQRGDIAMLMAPPDQPITIPMVRAQTAHQIEMDLRDELAKVR